MAFNKGDKVRVNEGLLEGQTGTVADTRENTTLVHLEDVAFGGGVLAFFTDTLVPGDEEHEALKAVKLYPDRLKAGYMWRLTTYVGGIVYVSHPMNGEMVKQVLKTPPAGLEEVDYAETAKIQHGGWKAVWQA